MAVLPKFKITRNNYGESLFEEGDQPQTPEAGTNSRSFTDI